MVKFTNKTINTITHQRDAASGAIFSSLTNCCFLLPPNFLRTKMILMHIMKNSIFIITTNIFEFIKKTKYNFYLFVELLNNDLNKNFNIL
jgi:hypothetical protein